MSSQPCHVTATSHEHMAWLDALRVFACFMVVFAHCCDGFVAQFDADRTSFLTGTLLGSITRPSVPLFVMMTGVLLLPVPQHITLAAFYRRRIGRIITPLIFWSLVLPVAAYLYFTHPGAASANPSVDLTAYTPAGLTNRLWTWLLNFNFDTTPLWYLYMLIGIYLIMPVISRWLDTATQHDIATFLKVWIATLFLPYLKLAAPAVGYLGNYGNMGLWGECDWNAFSAFHYVSGFIGYIVLAHYLHRYPLRWSAPRMWAVFVPMFIIGYAITAGGYVWLQSRYPGNYAYLEIVWLFTGINVFMMTLPLFVAARHLKVPCSPRLRALASLTFGIYLCHFFFVMVAYDLFDIPTLPYAARIVAMAVFSFSAAAIVTRLLFFSRLTRRLVA